MTKFQKLSIALKYYLHGAKYETALRALCYAKKLHSGVRKDQQTPEFQHQIEIALYITTIKNVVDEERAITVALLHDVREDYHIDHEEIEHVFGTDIAHDVKLLTKKFKNTIVDKTEYFENLTASPIAALVKGVDRINNLQTMSGVFTLPKQEQYVAEVNDYFQPMLKTASELYPSMFLAYMNIRTMLKHQTQIIEAVIKGTQFKEP